MKILFVIDYYQPQLGYSETHVTQQLSKQGHEVTLLTSDHYFPFPDFETTVGKTLGTRKQKAGRSEEGKVTIIRQPLLFEVATRAFFSGQSAILEKLQPDIVIVNGVLTFNAWYFALLSKKHHYKLVLFDSHLPSEFQNGPYVLKKLVYPLVSAVVSPLLNNRVSRFIAVQEDTAELMKNVYGITQPIEIISLGTDVELFKFSSSERTGIRKKYEIDTKTFVVIYTGKVIASKGVHLLCEAFAELSKKHPDSKLIIVGSGPEAYRKQSEQALGEAQSKTLWIPFQPVKSLPALYSAADVAVWPLQESTAMNDAASCSLPFIANDKIGAKERISNKNALIYKQGDSQDMAEKLLYLAQNTSKRKAMGKRGKELAETKLSWSERAQEYIAGLT